MKSIQRSLVLMLGAFLSFTVICSADQYEEVECNLTEEQRKNPSLSTAPDGIISIAIDHGSSEQEDESEKEVETGTSPQLPEPRLVKNAEKPKEKFDPVNTYQKTKDVLYNVIQKAAYIQDSYLRTEVLNGLAVNLQNPLMNSVGHFGYYSKVQPCLKNLDKDVRAIIANSEKAFNDCQSGYDRSHSSCVYVGKSKVDDANRIYISIRDCILANVSRP
ncbi:uncharacterized protein LOC129750176 [Uranotaenia lowii]|uniref:uncharacterized protein LOC129750176 n=1 Tax=Uranotaenia lowii TaxID=190385 RepID=UPI00247B20AB|nr:uncharacterized protein LOC129750176 [Uranotaenia lowii]